MGNVDQAAVTKPAVRAATNATYVAFAASGFAFASWAARIPQVRDRLDLDPATLGLVLLAIAAGSILALPMSGALVARVGSGRTVFATSLLLTVGLLTVAFGYLAGLVPVVAGLFLVGLGNGGWDVAMNVQGGVVERRLGRSIMSRFHAGFSVGTVAGALLGSAMVALRVPVTVHLLAVSVVVVAAVPLAARRFLHDHNLLDTEEGSGAPGATRASRGGSFSAWTEPRTLLIGLFVLAFAFTEGVGNDWIAIAAIDGHHVRPAVGTLAFAAFLTAMTIGRWFGPGLLDRHGRVAVVRVLAAVGIVGTALFVFAPALPLAFAGALLWGVGASLGFPIGMSAGGDDPGRAAGRVSVIASVGYCAFLGGPPTIGFLGDRVTVLRALLAVTALLGLAALISGAVAPPPGRR